METFSICWYRTSGPCRALLVKYTGFCPSLVSRIKAALTASFETARQRYRGSLSSGRERTGGLESTCLRCESACSHSSDHSKVASLRSSLKKGRACWADFAMKRDSAVSIPFKTWMDFLLLGVGSLENARHLSGLASIPRSVR